MQDSIFRFVNIRPPQRKGPLEGTIDYIDPYDGGHYTTAFRKQLASLVDMDRGPVRTLADEYILKRGGVSHLESLRNALARFDRAIARLGVNANVSTMEQAIQKA